MKTPLIRRVILSAAFLSVLEIASAHPGHDDGHELTWDMEHLVAFPGATLLCVGVVAAAVWGGRYVARRRSSAFDQSLRGLQDIRGK